MHAVEAIDLRFGRHDAPRLGIEGLCCDDGLAAW